MNVKHISDIDPFTVRHLDAWLERNARAEDIEETRAYMLQVVAEDEEYWAAQGWWRVHDTMIEDRYGLNRLHSTP